MHLTVPGKVGGGVSSSDDQGRVVSFRGKTREFPPYAFQADLLGCLASLQEAGVSWESHVLLLKLMRLCHSGEGSKTDDYRLAFVGVITKIKHISSADLSSCIVSISK